MDIIYTPKGSAREYAALGLNIYKGCTHRCRYCYCAHNRYIDAEKYFASPQPKKNVIERVKKDCMKLADKKDAPEILMSFMGDCYQPAEAGLNLTRRVIEVLIAYNLSFTVLTKGGILAARDFDLVKHYPRFRLGVSLSLVSPPWVKMYEPRAAAPAERIALLKAAKASGIPTWVSLEPVIDPLQALQIIHACKEFVDHWKIGALRHIPSDTHQLNWKSVRNDIEGYLCDVGADFYMKKSMTREE